MTETNLVDVLTAAGVLLANYWLYKLNGKFDRLDAMEKTQNVHVNTPGLHGAALAAAPPEK